MIEHNDAVRFGGCPADTELAAFVDGELAADARARLVTHLAACDDCREIVAMASLEASQRALPLTSVPWFRRRRLLVGLAAGLAASLAVVLIPSDPQPPASAWSDIAAALGPERTVAARLSLEDTYRPLASPTRSAPASAAPVDFELAAVAARLREVAEREPTTANLHAAGVAALMQGSTDEALRALAQAATSARVDAATYADLAAAYAARAARPTSPAAATADWLSAVQAAERACAVDPALPGGWFNRALALEGLGRAEASQAWQDYATRFPTDDGWRAEALGRVHVGAH